MKSALTLLDIAALSPFLILLLGALLLLIFEAFFEKTSKKISPFIALLTFIFAGIALFFSPPSENPLLTPWLRFDLFSKLFTLLFLSIGFLVTLLSASFFQRFQATEGEYFFFLISSVFGLSLIAFSEDFLTLFLGIETLSLSLYVWCSYMKKWSLSQEASIKYFLMGSLAAAFLLYGIALIYGAVGSTNFGTLAEGYKNLNTAPSSALFLGGIALVTLGFAFEAAIVPFHVWAPDVYDGAPTPVTAFMAVGTKAGAFAAFARVFLLSLPNFSILWNEMIAILAYLTLIYANFVAIRQVQLRRFFAYSGISHAGFLLIPLAAQTPDSLSALSFYLVVYTLATLGSFAVLAFLDTRDDGVFLEDLKGLFQRSPFLAGILSLCLLTLAGIPPTVGFFAKFYVLKVAFQGGFIGLVVVGLFTTILSAYYYLRIVATMITQEPDTKRAPEEAPSARVVGVISFCLILFFSCYPAPLMTLFNS